MERGRMLDNYIVKRKAPTLFSEVSADYVVMMSHAVDRYFSLSSALVAVLDYMTVTEVSIFTHMYKLAPFASKIYFCLSHLLLRLVISSLKWEKKILKCCITQNSNKITGI